MTQFNNNFQLASLGTVVDRAYEVKFRRTNVEAFIDINTSYGPDTLSIQDFAIELTGESHRNFGTNTTGSIVGYKLQEATVPIWVYDAGFQYTDQDARIAANSNLDPMQRKANAAFEAFRRKVYDIALSGVGSQYKGILNRTDYPQAARTSDVLWSAGNITADIIFADLNRLVAQIIDQTDETRVPNILAMPVKAKTILSQMIFPDDRSITVLDAFLRSVRATTGNANFAIESTHRLKNNLVCYDKNSESAEMYLTQLLAFLPEQRVGTGFDVMGNYALSPPVVRDLTGFAEMKSIL